MDEQREFAVISLFHAPVIAFQYGALIFRYSSILGSFRSVSQKPPESTVVHTDDRTTLRRQLSSSIVSSDSPNSFIALNT